MIKISEKSYIYRLALYGSQFDKYDIPTNLCPFIRRVLYGVGWCILLTIFGAIASAITLAPIAMLVISLIMDTEFIFTDVIVAGLTLYVAMAIFLGSVSLSIIKDETTVFEDMYDKVDSISTFHTLVVWLKALHEKTCPQIGFKDD